MVVVKVRETYDLHTTKNKMTVIGIHTPKPDIIKKNYPGLLLQCRAYRPLQCNVRVACASMLPLDPQGVGTSPGDVAPEDIFNPILYKAISNKGMSQIEARISAMNIGDAGTNLDVNGNSVGVDVDGLTNLSDEFPIYYSLLSNTHEWKHASPQSGLEMRGLRPLVYEMVYNVSDQGPEPLSIDNTWLPGDFHPGYPSSDGSTTNKLGLKGIIGKAKEFPFLNCTTYSKTSGSPGVPTQDTGFSAIANAEVKVPYLNVMCGVIIVPPSKLHELFYRLVCEWDIEFTSIRPISEITDWYGLTQVAAATHYQNYSYASAKEAITGSSDSIMNKDSCMVSSNVDIDKVM